MCSSDLVEHHGGRERKCVVVAAQANVSAAPRVVPVEQFLRQDGCRVGRHRRRRDGKREQRQNEAEGGPSLGALSFYAAQNCSIIACNPVWLRQPGPHDECSANAGRIGSGERSGGYVTPIAVMVQHGRSPLTGGGDDEEQAMSKAVDDGSPARMLVAAFSMAALLAWSGVHAADGVEIAEGCDNCHEIGRAHV